MPYLQQKKVMISFSNTFANVFFIYILCIIYFIDKTGAVVIAKKVSTIPNMVTSSQARGTIFLII